MSGGWCYFRLRNNGTAADPCLSDGGGGGGGVLKLRSHGEEANVEVVDIKENIALAFAFILCEYTSHYYTLS